MNKRHSVRRAGQALCSVALLVLFAEGGPSTAHAVGLCQPCVGLTTTDPEAAASALSTGASANIPAPDSQILYIRVGADLGSDVASLGKAASRLASIEGVRAWISVPITTPAPLTANGDALARELDQLAELARSSPAGTTFELQWTFRQAGDAGEASDLTPEEDAFLIKRAAVAVTGAQPDARVVYQLRSLDESFVRALFAEEVAAYLDGVAVRHRSLSAEGGEVEPLATVLAGLDPGSELAVTGAPASPPTRVFSTSARLTALGATIVFFDGHELDPGLLQAARLMAREFSGDVAFDPYSSASGAQTWAFVRGQDLSLRIVVEKPAGSGSLRLEFSSGQLSSPAILDPATGEASPLFGGSRSRRGYQLEIDDPPDAFVLTFERPNIASLAGVEGVEERLLVEDVRQMPVGEILRRLQATEDAQARRLDNYVAINATSLRFQIGTGVQSIDATYRGAFFYQRGQAPDWAWEEFLINGVRWRGKKVPQIPLIQPERASALPVEINFSRDYRYRLRGTATIEGRDCWVVDFQPTIRPEPGHSLFQGTVWIDRELYVRVRTRGVQLGLEGEVLSNDETIFYSPVDAGGGVAQWDSQAFYLPLRVVGQQLLSLLGSTTVLEREVLLTDLSLNVDDFEERRQAKLDSDYTMVRETDQGLRYLVPSKDGGREVQQEVDTTRLFLVGGVFYDKSLDFPLPLAGINWFAYDFRGTGTQVNAFFAGALLTLNVASPNLFGSKFTGGVDAFALAIRGTDSIFRGDREAEEEDIETLRPNIGFSIGRPIGSFFKLDLEYSLGSNRFHRADDTAPELVLPSDHLSHAFTLTARYNRKGYRLRASGTQVQRGEWDPWGLPGNTEFDPEHESYSLWGASLAKAWHLQSFQKIGASVEYFGGSDLDRFSKYEFGLFSDVSVHGYRSDRVRAEEAWASHLSYGFDIAELFRIDLVGDVAWATDFASGLDRELLAGVGLVGTLTGPWNTVLNIDLGVPVAGPDSGFSALVSVLKLFR